MIFVSIKTEGDKYHAYSNSDFLTGDGSSSVVYIPQMCTKQIEKLSKINSDFLRQDQNSGEENDDISRQKGFL